MGIIIKVNGEAIVNETEIGRKEQGEPFQEKRIVIDNERMGKLINTVVLTGRMCMVHHEFQLNQPVALSREVQEDVVQMDFLLQGSACDMQVGEMHTPHRFMAGQHNISYLTPSKINCIIPASEQILNHSLIVIPQELYARLLFPGSVLHRQYVMFKNRRKACFHAATNPPITRLMSCLLQDIRNCPHQGSFKRLFLESKITELLMLQLEQMQTPIPEISAVNEGDASKIREACELLDKYFTEPPTTVELARLVGLNEYTLKRSFKAQTGSTIWSYVTRLRMEAARRMLLEGIHTIGQVSYLVGYKNPSHFTAAFKKYYGHLPSVVQ